MSDFTVKHKLQLRMIIIPFHIRNVLSSPTETKLPPSSGRAAILMKEDTKHVKYNHVKIGKGFIGASKATAYLCLHACSLMSVQRTFWQWSTSERRSHILLASSCCRLPVKIFSKLTQVNLSLSLFQQHEALRRIATSSLDGVPSTHRRITPVAIYTTQAEKEQSRPKFFV